MYLNPWDYAAGILLIQGAGGQITDFTGKSLDPRKGSSVVGTNGYVHAELLKILLNG
ncbi:inositol monophosphatase family protein [Hungatella sp.]|uniref:inositol monophosphatase family protein n=1 Tax=Hungatella sp. TaxID=2613924 RepID=UPI0032E4B697